MRKSCWVLLILVLSAALAEASDLPYCQFVAAVDGDMREWREPFLSAAIVEPDGAAAERNQARIVACWTLDGLNLSVEIEDRELIAAPTPLDVNRYHQYDSLQIYIDPRGDAGERMNDDDINLLLLPDGRVGTLRGDALIGALSGASVPQRAGAPLVVEFAPQRTRSGWRFEITIPFAGIGIEPRTGLRLGVDVAMNDWLVDHPPGESEALTPERVRRLSEKGAAAPQTDPAVGTQLLPRTWDGDNDFGYPERWRSLQLAGGPSWIESVARQFGARLVFWVGSIGLLFGVAGAGLLHFWHRRQLRDLLTRIEQLSRNDSPTPAMPAGEKPAPIVDDAGADPRDKAFSERVLAHVRLHLAENLTPPELAAQFHVSLRTLQRRLKAGLDTSPQDLVLAARLEAARELLREGRWRVGEVAAKVGFDDLSHFSRRYRHAFGHAPSVDIARLSI